LYEPSRQADDAKNRLANAGAELAADGAAHAAG
jgi:hypothetical protein